ncbi:MAG: APC family permease [Candidatus Tyrphobacter sp.]
MALRRVLGVWSVVAFGVTNEIAAGLFFVSTQIQATAPGAGDFVPWLMLVGGFLTLLTALAYRTFFAYGLTGAGGEYVILRATVGRAGAFLATLLAWFGVTGSLGTLAYVAPGFLANACSALGFTHASIALQSHLGTLVCGLVLIWGAWLVHVRGVRLAGAVAVAAMLFVVAVALTLTGYGFATSHATFDAALVAHLHLTARHVIAAAPAQHQSVRAALWTALPLLFFGYLGLSTATQTGGEAIDARRSLSRGVLVAVAIVTTVYTLFTFAIYHAVPWRVIAGLAARHEATYATSTGLLGIVMPPWLSSLMNLFVAVIIVKTFVPLFLAQSRWVYAWAQDGVLPRALAATHPRFLSPLAALTIGALAGSLSLAESLSAGYVFGVSLRVLSVMAVFFLIGIGLMRYDPPVPIARVALGAAIAAFSAWFALSLVASSTREAFWLQPVVQSAIVLLCGALIYRTTSGLRRAPAPADPRAERPNT